MAIKAAGTDYHRQDSANGCGAAAAMMILSDEQVGIKLADLGQKDLFEIGHNPKIPDWDMHPTGLEIVLNAKKKDEFSIRGEKNYQDGLGVIAATLDRREVAPAVLLRGGDHWVVVDELVTNGVGPNEELVEVHIHDPWSSNGDPPDPHKKDDTCKATGYADKIYTAYEWEVEQFIECQCEVNGTPSGDFPVVAANFSGPLVYLKTFRPPPLDIPPGFIDKHWLQDNFIKLVRRYKMEESLPLQITPGLPRIVTLRRRGRMGEEEGYYLVSLMRSERIVGVASFEARTGNLQSIQRLGEGAHVSELLGIPKLRDDGQEGVRDYLVSVVADLEEILSVPLDSVDWSRVPVSETPVWRSCQQSRSEYLPFWVVTILEMKVYIRLDGKIFSGLTKGPFGA